MFRVCTEHSVSMMNVNDTYVSLKFHIWKISEKMGLFMSAVTGVLVVFGNRN